MPVHENSLKNLKRGNPATQFPNNKPGRKKKVYKHFMNNGFSPEETRNCFSSIAGLTMEEARKIIKDPKITLLERLTLEAYLKAIKDKDYSKASQIIEMFAGKATQKIEAKVDDITSLKVLE